MLTVDFRRLRLRPGQTLLDLGCGGGRHAYEASKRGARVVALDRNVDELHTVASYAEAMRAAGEIPSGAFTAPVRGDALALPFADATFDRVVAAEVLEHIPQDRPAIAELVRVLRPGGVLAVTVPRWLPELVCWTLSREYHQVEGGHVRIYRRGELVAKLQGAGLDVGGWHHAHALHSPYWWLRCLFGVHDTEAALPNLYHRLLVWDIMARPVVTRIAESALNPFIGKSLVVYATKPQEARSFDEAEAA